MPNLRGELSTSVTTSTAATTMATALFGGIKQTERSNLSAANGSESVPFTGDNSSTQMIGAFGSSAAITSSTAEIDSGNQSTHLSSVTLNYTDPTVMGVTTRQSVVNFSSPSTSSFSDSSYSSPFNASSGLVTVWTSASTPTVQTKMEEVCLLSLS